MRRLRTASTSRLLAIAAVLVAVVAGAGIAQGALSTADKPAPKPLDRAILDAVNAPPAEGVTARITFTNNLLPSGSLPEQQASPTLTGATGRLWLARDGRLRLELQSSGGDAQIVSDGKRFLFYDARSEAAITGALPDDGTEERSRHERTTLQDVQRGLAKLGELWTISGATPTTTADRPSYTVRIAPKDDGGLLGAAELAWDAVRGVPLRAAIYAQGEQDPVLELEATDISYGPIDASKIDTTPPPGARVTELNAPSGVDAHGRPVHVEGIEAVQKELDFPLAAPDELAGLPRREVQLVRFGNRKGAMVTYGRGLGAIMVLQQRAQPGGQPAGHNRLRLPQVNIDGATGTELGTALGTVVQFETQGISHVVVGSVPPAVAENAARGLR